MRARTAVIAGFSSAALLAAPVAGFASTPTGGGSPTPPGFGPTITACTAGPASCTLTAKRHKCDLTVTVPAGAFATKTDIVISKISNKSADTHFTSHKSKCAFGIAFIRDGSLVSVPKANPAVLLDFTGTPIKPNDLLRSLVPGGSKGKKAKFTDGEATSTLRSTHELAIVSP